uniref:mucin-17-like n=2 Tax=Oncorhynchus gorbuscha TaxID=8017 RepID=UPI001EAF75B8|nr:mucin-17-like [Oncorhynchus gorbuscha]
MAGSKHLCPVCNTTGLNLNTKELPNHNTCTQCKTVVCSLCGFSPPDSGGKEWLCLTCQMQRALGGSYPPGPPKMKPQPSPNKASTSRAPQNKDTPTPDSPQRKPATSATQPPKTEVAKAADPQKPASSAPAQKTIQENRRTSGLQKPPEQPGQSGLKQSNASPSTQQEPGKPQRSGASPAKAVPPEAQPTKQESGGFFDFGGPKSQPAPSKPEESVSGKMFGFGSSIFSSASTLITSAVHDEPRFTPPASPKVSAPVQASPKMPPAKEIKPPAAQRAEENKAEQPQQATFPPSVQAKVDKLPSEPPNGAASSQPAPKAGQSTCPLCKVEFNKGSKDPPNYNTCTECKNTVCNLCGFNPMPHVTELKEWLCLNCQTKRMESPRPPMIKPQPSPNNGSAPQRTTVPPSTPQKKGTPTPDSPQRKPATSATQPPKTEVAKAADPQKPASSAPAQKTIQENRRTSGLQKPPEQPGQPGLKQSNASPSTQQEPGKPQRSGASPAKAVPPEAQPTKQETGGFFDFGGPKSQPAPSKPEESVSGKMFGFGSSIFSSASTLITSAVHDEPRFTPPASPKVSAPVQASPKMPPAKEIKPPAAQRAEENKAEQPQQATFPPSLQAKVDKLPSEPPNGAASSQPAPKAGQSTCPLCKVEFNKGSKDPPNYNTCTECKNTVCNLCGFNPMPHVTELKEWLCLNCQTKRMESPRPPMIKPQPSPNNGSAPQRTTVPPSTPQKKGTPTPDSPQRKPATSATQPPKTEVAKAADPQKPASSAPAQKTIQENRRTSGLQKPPEQPGQPGLKQSNASPSTQQEPGKPQQQPPKSGASPAKAVPPEAQPTKEQSGGFSDFAGAKSQPAQSKPEESVSGKMFGFGSSIFSSASTLITSAVHDEPRFTPPASPKVSAPASPKMPPAKEIKPPAARRADEKKAEHPQQATFPPSVQAKVDKPPSEPPNGAASSQPAPKAGQSTCPLCKVELNKGSKDPPNYNTCTECKNTVCNLCGFNPMPHVSEVKEWLCLNCQMQRALGGMEDPEHPMMKPKPSPNQVSAPAAPRNKDTPTSSGPYKVATAPASPKKEPVTRTSQPVPSKPKDSVSGKMFGFGSSIFSSASTLITSAVQDEPHTTPPASPKVSTTAHASPKMPPAKEIKPPAAQKAEEKKAEQSQQVKVPPSVHAKVDKPPSAPPKGAASSQPAPKAGQSTCPLCKVELNKGSKDPPNYNTCTECKNTVCNLCGFNPMPHGSEVKEWLCLNCQMQRALGGMEPPGTPMMKHSISKVLTPVAPQKKDTLTPAGVPKVATSPTSLKMEPVTRASQPVPSKPEDSVSGKMFGFGSSIFSSASTLITSDVQDESHTTPPASPKVSAAAQASPKMPPAKETKPPAAQNAEEKKAAHPQKANVPPSVHAKVDKPPSAFSQPAPKAGQSTCPLCKVELNMGSKDPPNYNTCIECKNTVCNLCGFNPIPNVPEVKEWLCLNCQMQRALGGMEPPGPPMMKPQPLPSKVSTPVALQKEDATSAEFQKEKETTITAADLLKVTPTLQKEETTTLAAPQKEARLPASSKMSPQNKNNPAPPGVSLVNEVPIPALPVNKISAFLIKEAPTPASDLTKEEPTPAYPLIKKAQTAASPIIKEARTPASALIKEEQTPASPLIKEAPTPFLPFKVVRASPLNKEAPSPASPASPQKKKEPQLPGSPDRKVAPKPDSMQDKEVDPSGLPLKKEAPPLGAEETKEVQAPAAIQSNEAPIPSSSKTKDTPTVHTPLKNETSSIEMSIENQKHAIVQKSVEQSATPTTKQNETVQPLQQPENQMPAWEQLATQPLPQVQPQETPYPKITSPKQEPRKPANPAPAQKSPQMSRTSEPKTPPQQPRIPGRRQSSVILATQQPPKQESGGLFGFGGPKSQSTPSKPEESASPKVSAPASPKMPPTKETKPLAVQNAEKKAEQPQQAKVPPSVQAKVDKPQSEPQPQKGAASSQPAPKAYQSTCPLCKVELNMGSKDPSNYNTCTECKNTVCNVCGFNPMPNVTEVNEWLCLNCQMQRALGGMESPGPPMMKPSPSKVSTSAASQKYTVGPVTTQNENPTPAGQQKVAPTPASPRKEPVTSASQPAPSKLKESVSGKMFGFGSSIFTSASTLMTSTVQDEPRTTTPASPKFAIPVGPKQKDTPRPAGLKQVDHKTASPKKVSMTPASEKDNKTLAPGSPQKEASPAMASQQDQKPVDKPTTTLIQKPIQQKTPQQQGQPPRPLAEPLKLQQQLPKGGASNAITVPAPQSQPHKQESGGFFGFGGAKSQPAQSKPEDSVSGKMLGFGSSIFSSASTLITSAVQDEHRTTPPASPKVSMTPASVKETPAAGSSQKKEVSPTVVCQQDQKPVDRPTPTLVQQPPQQKTLQQQGQPPQPSAEAPKSEPDISIVEAATAADTQNPASPVPAQKAPLENRRTSEPHKPPQQPSPGRRESSAFPATKQPPKQESGGLFGFGGPKSQSVSSKPEESVSGKMFGFGSSIFSSASTLITSVVQDEPRTTPPASPKMSALAQTSPKMPPAKETKLPAAQKAEEKKAAHPQKANVPPSVHAKVDKPPSAPPKGAASSQPAPKAGQSTCPLCKVELNKGSKDPPNYNTCTECKNTVCNLCGFNPMPHETVKEWLCLTCQMQRALGAVGPPGPPMMKSQPLPSIVSTPVALQKENVTPAASPKPTPAPAKPQKEEIPVPAAGQQEITPPTVPQETPIPAGTPAPNADKKEETPPLGSSQNKQASPPLAEKENQEPIIVQKPVDQPIPATPKTSGAATPVQQPEKKTPPLQQPASKASQQVQPQQAPKPDLETAPLKEPMTPASEKEKKNPAPGSPQKELSPAVASQQDKTPVDKSTPTPVQHPPHQETPQQQEQQRQLLTATPKGEPGKPQQQLPKGGASYAKSVPSPQAQPPKQESGGFFGFGGAKSQPAQSKPEDSVSGKMLGFGSSIFSSASTLITSAVQDEHRTTPPASPKVSMTPASVKETPAAGSSQKKEVSPTVVCQQDQKPVDRPTPTLVQQPPQQKTLQQQGQPPQPSAEAPKSEPDISIVEAATAADTQNPASPVPAQKAPLENRRTSEPHKPPQQPSPGRRESSAFPATKQPPKQESGGLFGFGGPKSQSVSSKPEESVSGKMFGFGSSIFSSASTLITSVVQDEPRTTPPASPKMRPNYLLLRKQRRRKQLILRRPMSPPSVHAKVDKPPSAPPKGAASSQPAPKAGQSTCPLCKVELNKGSKDPPNYNTCTECKNTVCNLCGFNPMPHETVKEWLCLTCQMQRALGAVGPPGPPMMKSQPLPSIVSTPVALQKENVTPAASPKPTPAPAKPQKEEIPVPAAGQQEITPPTVPQETPIPAGTPAPNADKKEETPPLGSSQNKQASPPLAEKENQEPIIVQKPVDQPIPATPKTSGAATPVQQPEKQTPPLQQPASKASQQVQPQQAPKPDLETAPLKEPMTPASEKEKKNPAPGSPQKELSPAVASQQDKMPVDKSTPTPVQHPPHQETPQQQEQQRQLLTATPKGEPGKPQQQLPKGGASYAKSVPSPQAQPPKQESGGFFGFGGAKSQPAQSKPEDSVSGKMLGFGSSIFSSASTLITSAVQDEHRTTPPASPKVSMTPASVKETPAAGSSQKKEVSPTVVCQQDQKPVDRPTPTLVQQPPQQKTLQQQGQPPQPSAEAPKSEPDISIVEAATAADTQNPASPVPAQKAPLENRRTSEPHKPPQQPSPGRRESSAFPATNFPQDVCTGPDLPQDAPCKGDQTTCCSESRGEESSASSEGQCPPPSVHAKVDKPPSAPPKGAASSQPAPKAGQSTCPLCKVELNKGSKDPPNYNTCTECKNTVCNLCGFNPMPHETVKEWLCLTCQMQRALGAVGPPGPPMMKSQPLPSIVSTPVALQKENVTPAASPKPTPAPAKPQKEEIPVPAAGQQEITPPTVPQETPIPAGTPAPNADKKEETPPLGSSQNKQASPPLAEKENQEPIIVQKPVDQPIPATPKTSGAATPVQQPEKQTPPLQQPASKASQQVQPQQAPKPDLETAPLKEPMTPASEKEKKNPAPGSPQKELSPAVASQQDKMPVDKSTPTPVQHPPHQETPQQQEQQRQLLTATPKGEPGKPQQQLPKGGASYAKSVPSPQAQPPKQESGGFFGFGGAKSQPAQSKPEDSVSGKMLGFGSSIFSSASTLITSAVQDEHRTTPPASPKVSMTPASVKETPAAGSSQKKEVSPTVVCQQDQKPVDRPTPTLVQPSQQKTLQQQGQPPQPSAEAPKSEPDISIAEAATAADTQNPASPVPAQKAPLENRRTSEPHKPPQQPSPGRRESSAFPATKQPPKQESGGLFGFGGPKSQSASSKPEESVSGKMFGFGSSIFSSASTLITSVVQDEPRPHRQLPPRCLHWPRPPQDAPAKETKLPAAQKAEEKKAAHPQKANVPPSVHAKVDKPPSAPPKGAASSQPAPKAGQSTCPLCKVELNKGSKDPPNYNTCTECKNTVCNLCGFNPMPHETVKEWLCLTCQMQRALGAVGPPGPPMMKSQPLPSIVSTPVALQKENVTPAASPKPTPAPAKPQKEEIPVPAAGQQEITPPTVPQETPIPAGTPAPNADKKEETPPLGSSQNKQASPPLAEKENQEPIIVQKPVDQPIPATPKTSGAATPVQQPEKQTPPLQQPASKASQQVQPQQAPKPDLETAPLKEPMTPASEKEKKNPAPGSPQKELSPAVASQQDKMPVDKSTPTPVQHPPHQETPQQQEQQRQLLTATPKGEPGKPQQQLPKGGASYAKSVPSPQAQPPKQESGGFFGFGGAKSQPAQSKPEDSVSGKMLGFGSSIFSSASTLITSAVQDEHRTTPPASPKVSMTPASVKETPAAGSSQKKEVSPTVVCQQDQKPVDRPTPTLVQQPSQQKTLQQQGQPPQPSAEAPKSEPDISIVEAATAADTQNPASPVPAQKAPLENRRTSEPHKPPQQPSPGRRESSAFPATKQPPKQESGGLFGFGGPKSQSASSKPEDCSG